MPILIENKKLKSYYARINQIVRDEETIAYFMLILSLFSLSFFGIFALKPTFETITRLQKEVADSQDVFDKLQTKGKNLLILQNEYRILEEDLPIVYAALPTQVNAPNFLLSIRTLATLNSLQVLNLQITKSPLSESESSNKAVTSSFSLVANGSYKNINDFLKRLSTLDRVVIFSNIEVTPGTIGASDILILKLNGKIYTLFD